MCVCVCVCACVRVCVCACVRLCVCAYMCKSTHHCKCNSCSMFHCVLSVYPAQVEELEHSLAESDTKLQKSEEEYVRVTEALQHQLNVVTEEYNRYQMASEKLKGGLTRKNDELEAKVLALGGELRERDSTINAMSSESSGLQSRIMALSGEIDELARNKSELENRLRKERSSVDASVRRAEEQVRVQ